MKQIIIALKEVFLSYTPERSFLESIVKIDFKIGDYKTNMIQLCFSNLASWPLVIIGLLIYFDPFKYSWSLVNVLSFTNPVVLFLLNGQMLSMISFFIIFFVLQWLFRREFLLQGLILYFTNRSELHIHLAVVGVLAIYLSRICYLMWLSLDSISHTRTVWQAVGKLQLVAWLVSAILVMSTIDYIQVRHLFKEGTELSRFNFLCVAIIVYHSTSHLFLSLWGHFYVQLKKDPSQLYTYFSTARWILRFDPSYHFQTLLKNRISDQIEQHEKSMVQYEELKTLNKNIALSSVHHVLAQEITFLKEAQLRLSKI